MTTKTKTLLLDQTKGRLRKGQEKILNHQRNLLHPRNPLKTKTSKSCKSLTAEEPDEEHMHEMLMDAKENIVNEMGNVEEQHDGESKPKTNNAPKNDWFKQPLRPPTPDPEWNKCHVINDQLKQTWFSDLVSDQKDPRTFDKLMATHIGFSKFAKNHLKLDKITKAYLVGPEIVVRRADRQLYKFKKGDFVNLYLNDIEDMLLLVVQHKLFHLDGDVIVDLVVALRMFIRSLIIKRRVEDVQLGVEIYQKKLNITQVQKDFLVLSAKEPYTPSFDPQELSMKI
nr:hypothetical protein [Tanacetum cinerariifolium]